MDERMVDDELGRRSDADLQREWDEAFSWRDWQTIEIINEELERRRQVTEDDGGE